MDMPLGRKATPADYLQVVSELANALGFEDIPNEWYMVAGYNFLFTLMVKYQVFPTPKSDHHDYVKVPWGPHSEDARVVPIAEHASLRDATAFAIVLAITSKVEASKS